MKKQTGVVRSVITWIILIFAVAMMLFTFISVSVFNRNDRSIAGYKAFVVLSDSMKATDFEAGDVVVIKEVDPSTLKAGDIITFTSRDSSSFGETITHKIRRLAETAEGEPGFVTYGTSSGTDDLTVVDYFSVEGKYLFRIPKVGRFFNFIKTVPGYVCCILIPFLLFIAIQGVNIIRALKGYRKEQADELQAQRDELAAEKKRTEDMLAELETLRAQLSGSSGAGKPDDETSGDDNTAGNDEK